jgi:CheY-like chemotaxis protein
VAEDEAINRLALVRTLEKLGYTVSQAVNGLQVLDLLAREPYDAVLLDIQMPFMSGIEVARRIRSSASGAIDPHTPVIALTAYAMAGDRERFMEAGMDDYLAKPVDHEELRRVLNRLPRRDG